VPVEVLDNDTAPENITITTSTGRVWYDAGNGTLSFLYPNGTSFQQVEVTVSDGEDSSSYWVNVTPKESDEPPVVKLPHMFNISLDAQGILDLTPFATDLESGSEQLVWAVVTAPSEIVAVMQDGHLLQLLPVATEEGDHVVTLSVTDPDENVVQAELLVRIGAQVHHAPEILMGDDALPLTLKVVRGEELEVNLALQKYWYDREDFNRPQVMRWEAVSLRPSLFTVEIGQDQELIITAFDRTGAGYLTLRLIDSDGDVSKTESVRVEVVEPSSIASSWVTYILAALVLIIVVGALMMVARGRGSRTAKPARPGKAPSKAALPDEGPAPTEAAEAAEAPGAPTAPAAVVPGRVVQVLMVHESTSLMAQMTGDEGHALTPEKEDELIEQSTLFAQERFEGASVGTIKAFKFDGTEVLVGKGKNYFLVTRCTGTGFDGVVSEMKRSIINIDVGMGERLDKWYPGQQVTPLEDELRELLAGGGT
jgi:hypothetical protein